MVSVGVVTTEFTDAAAAQNKTLAFEPALVFVPHPIQDRTTEELHALAENYLEEIIDRLCTMG